MCLLPYYCQSTYRQRYSSRLNDPPHILTPLNEPETMQMQRLLSCSLRPNPYKKGK